MTRLDPRTLIIPGPSLTDAEVHQEFGDDVAILRTEDEALRYVEDGTRFVGVMFYEDADWAARGIAEMMLGMPLYPVLRYFTYLHLPEHLQARSQPFADLAESLAWDLPQGPETEMALRKLLEAKDAAVRSALDLPGAI